MPSLEKLPFNFWTMFVTENCGQSVGDNDKYETGSWLSMSKDQEEKKLEFKMCKKNIHKYKHAKQIQNYKHKMMNRN